MRIDKKRLLFQCKKHARRAFSTDPYLREHLDPKLTKADYNRMIVHVSWVMYTFVLNMEEKKISVNK